jgi:hypothetical protein
VSWRASAYIKSLIVCPSGEPISRTEKLVALVLADSHQDKSENFTFPSVKMIANDSLMDPRVCRRVLASLERKGVIARERPESQGRGQLTFYRFPDLDGEKAVESGKSKASKGGHGVLLFSAKRRTEGGRKGDRTTPPSYGVTGTGTKANTTPPNPLVNEGGGGLQKPNLANSALETPGVDAAVEQVMQGCGFTARRLGPVLREVIRQQADRGEPPPTTALAMIAAWKSYILQGSKLRVRWGARRFFAEGYWSKPDGWPWDGAALREERMQAEAQIGSYAPQ